MKIRATLSGLTMATILSRLLLILGLLLGDLIPDPRTAQAAAPAPMGAADLPDGPIPAILRSDAGQQIAALPQDDAPDAVMANASGLPAPDAAAQALARRSGTTLPQGRAHLRPYPHGPPSV